MDTEEREQFKKYVVTVYRDMNVSKNPRTNIYDYAIRHGSTLENNIVNLDHLFNIILDRDDLHYPSLLKAKKFYRSANHKTLLESGEIYEKFCEYSDGWPALNRNWHADKFDWIRTLGFLHKLGMESVFRINVRYTSTQTLFTLSLQKYYRNNTSEIIYYMFEEEGNIYSEGNAEIIEELSSVIAGLNNLFPRNYRQRREILVRYTAEELRSRPGFDFATFFEVYLGQPINDDYIFCLEFPQYADEYLNFLSQQKPRGLATYIMVQTKQFLDYSDPVKMSLKYFAPAVIAAMMSEYFNESDRRKQVEIFTRFSNLYEKMTSEADMEHNLSLTRSLQNRNSFIEYVLEEFSQEKVDREYENWEIHEDDYYRNSMNISTYSTPDSLRAFHLADTPEIERWKLNVPEFVIDCFKSHDKPMVYYFNHYMFQHVNKIPRLKFKENKFNAKIISKYCGKNGLEFTEDEIMRQERFLCAYRYTFDDYRNWLKENVLIAREQEDFLSYIGLDNYQLYFISFYQTSRMCRENPIVDYLALKHFRNYKEQSYDSEDDY